MTRPGFHGKCVLITITLVFHLSALTAMAQTTGFTYQGRLTDGGTAPTGNYDLQFALFDSLSGGAQVGSTQTLNTVAVSNGVFTVSLDFGASAFSGASRFLEISARPSGGGAFTLLSPRQQITSTPYALRSLNATSADSVPAATVINATTQYNLGGNRILSNAGEDNLFAGVAAGQSNTGISNAFFGFRAGQSNTEGGFNSFFGSNAGESNTIGTANAFFGHNAGFSNTFDNADPFSGSYNAFFGASAGLSHTTGNSNSFFGYDVGESTTVGSRNSFFGRTAGLNNDNGNNNVFLGADAGLFNVSGSGNIAIGADSNFASGGLTNAMAIGTMARADQSNSMVLGSVAGVNGATTSVNVGIGTTTPQSRLHVVGSSWFQGDNTPLPFNAGKGVLIGFSGDQGHIFAFDYGGSFSGRNLLLNHPGGNVGIGTTTPLATLHVNGGGALITTGSNREVSIGNPNGESGIGIRNTSNRADVRFDGTHLRLVAGSGTGPPVATSGIAIDTAGNVGIGATPSSKLTVGGKLRLDQIDSGLGEGTIQLCRNPANVIATCSSSLRYKQAIVPFSGGLDLIRRLRPISFTWKADGSRDVGLGAEDVAQVEPLFVTHNDKDEIEGVKYDRLSIVLINAIQEQQGQIESLRAQNAALNARLQAIEKRSRNSITSRRRAR